MKSEEAKDLAKRFHRLSKSKTDWVKEHSDSMVESDGRAHVKVDLRKTVALNLYSGGTRIHPDILEFIEDEAIYTEVESHYLLISMLKRKMLSLISCWLKK